MDTGSWPERYASHVGRIDVLIGLEAAHPAYNGQSVAGGQATIFV